MAFLGRERELAQLAEAVRRVAEGRLGRVVLTGPAGIGCTRLLDELWIRVSSVPGVLACRGRAYEPAMGVPYQAVAEALAGSFARLPDERIAEVVANVGDDLCALVPYLRPRLQALAVDHDPPRLIAPDQLGRRVLETVLGTLERLAGDGVLVLMLENVHHADPATHRLIEALQDVGRSLPVCMILSYQPDEVHRRHPMAALADSLGADLDVSHIELGPMVAADIERLVIDAIGEQPAQNVLAAVIEGARGNPLIALELARSAGSLEGVRLSDPFDQLYGARVEALSRDGARVVRVLAAARLPLPRSTVLGVRPPEGRLTVQGLQEAIAGGYVAEDGERISISHELCAEAVESVELTLERQGIHAALAEQLHEQPTLAAWHWSRAARPAEARAEHLRAAQQVARLDPAETALHHYEAALELPSLEPVSPQAQSDLLAGAARASASAGSFRRAAALMRRAIDSRATRDASSQRGGRDAATRLTLGEMHEELGRYQWHAGDLHGAIDNMERALGIMPTEPSRRRAWVQASLAQHLMIDGRFKESMDIARQALVTADAAAAGGEDTLQERAHAICTQGVDVAYLGDPGHGLELLEEAASLSRQAGRLDHLMRVAANRTTLLDLDLRREEALSVVQEFLAEAAAGGLEATYGAFLRGNAADILFQLGRWEEAERECRSDLRWQTGRREITWLSLLVLGLLLTESRADEEAASIVGRTLLELQAVPPGHWTGMVMRSAVSLALWNDRVDEAVSIAEREWPRAVESDELGVVAYAAATALEAAAAAAEHGRATSDAGLIARARALATNVLPAAEAYVAGSSLGPELGARSEAELLLDVARAHAQRVRGTADAHVWAELAEAWERASVPYRRAKARWWQALAILAAASEEDREAARLEARGPLAEAYRLARDLPALPLLREVVDLAKRARVALPVTEDAAGRLVAVGPGAKSPVAVGPGLPDATGSGSSDIAQAIEERVLASLRRGPADLYGLSPREREVLDILAEGRTDRDIAARLFISERTVHVHVRRILAKLGVSSRTEAAGVAIRQGLVPEAAPASRDPSGPDDVASRS
ncbi:MAG: AAA family ATPase [Candidatus Limnocylindrales bacterium]